MHINGFICLNLGDLYGFKGHFPDLTHDIYTFCKFKKQLSINNRKLSNPNLNEAIYVYLE